MRFRCSTIFNQCFIGNFWKVFASEQILWTSQYFYEITASSQCRWI